ncbi:hypothetical protein FIV42_18935 [Persicimonas caeni]|uniref:Uncharacterized protein n=1 Tax=Persicimonas caeni TaxID=2292766 RepID=A0A4Y6PWY2_PERCE|nr:hypothetical protein [Persicimonas caeni]QDG52740.1 hypothetical protein FIV42_18935 [Persicimonas caeni]QED33962.1 hypothetical protein FRD00_18930 [Persicimonas caeni]
MPELLATDGQTVRRMIADRTQLAFQQFDCERTAQAIVDSVESHSTAGIGICGYSMYSDAEALAIVHTGEKLDAGWLAFPYTTSASGRPAGIPTLPVYLNEIPTVRLCGGAHLHWRHCRLVLEVAIEQRSEGHDAPLQIDLLDHLASWRLRTTVLENGRAKLVRLPARQHSEVEICRPSPTRAEASFEIDANLYRQLVDRDELSAWLVLDFDRRLFCLPSEWATWWFQVRFPRHIQC